VCKVSECVIFVYAGAKKFGVTARGKYLGGCIGYDGAGKYGVNAEEEVQGGLGRAHSARCEALVKYK